MHEIALNKSRRPLISNLDVLINSIENSIPIMTDSIISINDNRNSGKIYISAPVLIKTGGNKIFLAEAGFLAAFMRINIAKIAIKDRTN